MVKFLVESGIDSISVNADVAKEISDYVAQIEKEFLGKKGELPRHYNPQRKFQHHDKKQFNELEKKREIVDASQQEDLELLEENP